MDKKERERLTQLGPIPGITAIADRMKQEIAVYGYHTSKRGRQKQIAEMLQLVSMLTGHLAFAANLEERVAEIDKEIRQQRRPKLRLA